VPNWISASESELGARSGAANQNWSREPESEQGAGTGVGSSSRVRVGAAGLH